jgi:soluble lytic murein transglycosylase
MKTRFVSTAFLSILLLNSAAAAVRNSGADEAVLVARDAYRAGNSAKLARAAAQVGDHVLAPYVEYWRLRLSLDHVSAYEVRDFLARNAGTLVAEQLRAEWLKLLGKSGQWAPFREERPLLFTEDAEIACYGLLERWLAGDQSALDEVTVLWRAPKDLPEGCIPLVEYLMRSNQYGSQQVWERFRILAEADRISALKKVLAFLPRHEAPDVKSLDQALSAPAKYLQNSPRALRTRASRELAMLALARLARSEPQAAAERWDERLRENFSPEDQSRVWGHIATWAARSHMLEANEWYARASGTHLSDEQLAWKVRSALRSGAWTEVRAAIERMSLQARSDPTWIYWSGRAAKELGRTDEAQGFFTRIAGDYRFYGRLAAEELGLPLEVPPRPPAASAEDIAQAAANPGLQRALALFALGMRSEGVKEWNWSLWAMDDRQLIAAAELARRNEIWDRAIQTAERTVAMHDFSLRYPIPYREVFAGSARARDLEEYWIFGLVRQESRFISNARSSAGASGLMQLMPATARWVANKMGMRDFSWSKINAVDVNAALGTYYLRRMLDQLDGQPVLAATAYNAGPGRARRWLDSKPLDGAIYIESIPFSETRDYVKKVMINTLYYAAVHGGEPRSLKTRLGMVAPRSLADVAAVDTP